MTSKNKKWLIEVLWWLVTIVIVGLILIPIFNANLDYKFLNYNIVFGFSALTLLRYLLLFDFHPLSNSKIFKVLFIFSVPILFFPILEGIHDFLEFCDREGLQSMMAHLEMSEQNSLSNYIRVEYLILGISSMAGMLLMIGKMVRSLWVQYKFQSEL